MLHHRRHTYNMNKSQTDIYHIVEDETGVREFEVFEKAVEFAAVQGAPGTVKIISGLRLLPRVIVVQKLSDKRRQVLLRGNTQLVNLQQKYTGDSRTVTFWYTKFI